MEGLNDMMSFPDVCSASGPLWVTHVFQCFSNIWPNNMDPERSHLDISSEMMVLEFIGLGKNVFDPGQLLVTLCLSEELGDKVKLGVPRELAPVCCVRGDFQALFDIE